MKYVEYSVILVMEKKVKQEGLTGNIRRGFSKYCAQLHFKNWFNTISFAKLLSVL